jgi:hypothetical protein
MKGLFTGEDDDDKEKAVTGAGTRAFEEAHAKYAWVLPAFIFSCMGTITMSL